ncbi:hypothetical protein [Saccharomonospora cyanea]|uniref:Uncharacterized protein n=1 Tax=Saccharomonospora cyanea NA-134 TaxID=882082 RepID=H5XEY0_9PSEU|nr:hypothetical protein [Saccharomonospora cyanea]EHR60374.1 hypothetical protein SaccyDRAFT_1471 [Saccharomonospora cyanea NA-134]
MADRSISVRLKADVAQYMANMKRAGRVTSEAMDEAEKSTAGLGTAADKVARRANLQFNALATTVGSALPAASSAAIAAMTTGAAAGFAALGAVALRENEAVRASFESLGSTVSDGLAQDAAVMESAFTGAAAEIGAAYERMRPQLQEAFTASVPAVESMTDGVIALGENALPGLVLSVQRAEPVFDGFESALGSLGSGIGEFAEVTSRSSEAVGLGLEHLGDLTEEVLGGMAPLLGDLSALWADNGDEVAEAVGRILDVIGELSGGAMPVMSTAVGSAVDVLNALLAVLEPIAGAIGPMVGTWLSVAAAMKAVGATRSAIAGVSTAVGNLGDSMARANRPAATFRTVGAGMALAAAMAADEMLRLRPNVDGLVASLNTLNREGRLSGEALSVFGDDLSGVQQALDMVNDTGVTRWLNEVGEGLPLMASFTTTLGEAEAALGSLDDALVRIAEEQGLDAAQGAFNDLVDRAGLSSDAVQDLRDRLPGFADAMSDAANATSEASEALNTYLESQRAATDPVFALGQAIRGVDEAQRAYNKAVKDYGANSPQAREASWALAEAVSGAEQAALNGEISFEEFEARLQDWVAQGAITGKQADDIRNRVADLRGEAEDYRGNYAADFKANTADAVRKLGGIIRMINGIPRTVTTTHNVVTYYSSRGNRVGTQNSAGEWYQGGGGYADGGLVRGPGGPRTDSIPAMLSAGEFVVNAKATQDHLPLLEALNSGRSTGASDTRVNGVRSVPGSSATVVNNYNLSAPHYVGSKDDLLRTLRKEVSKAYGGNVQKALGKA